MVKYYCNNCKCEHFRGKVYKQHIKFKELLISDLPDVDISDLNINKQKLRCIQELYNEMQFNMYKNWGYKLMSL